MAYSPEEISTISETICQRLAAGESMVRICADAGMPKRLTVDRWRDENPDFDTRCARAREAQAEFHHDQMDIIESRVLTGDLDPHAANVVLSNKRWRMSKLAARVYGDKIGLTVDATVTASVSYLANIPTRSG